MTAPVLQTARRGTDATDTVNSLEYRKPDKVGIISNSPSSFTTDEVYMPRR